MNNRQKLKKLKSDNELMHRIINNTPEMQRLYKAYNDPIKNVVYTTMRFRQYKCSRRLLPELDSEEYRDLCKIAIKQELCEQIRDKIVFDIGTAGYRYIEGSIFLGSVDEPVDESLDESNINVGDETGRHFPQIAEILEKMKGDEE